MQQILFSDGRFFCEGAVTPHNDTPGVFGRNVDVVIFGDAKDYYYIAYLEDDEMKHGFILKSDYIKGNKKIIGAY